MTHTILCAQEMNNMHTTQSYKIGDTAELMRNMPAQSIDTIVTSPPYWGLRDYGVDEQIGLEPTLEDYHARLLEVTAECMRLLKPTGVMFWNHGDSYGGSGGSGGDYADGGLREGQPKVGRGGGVSKCMVMQNERLIIKMIDQQGWILRNRIIWNKPNGMPSSVTDRFSNKYEPVYMLTKNQRYWFDLDAVRTPHKEPERSGIKENRLMKKGTDGYSHGGWDYDHRIYNPLGKNPGDVWTIPTKPYPDSHFATFPTTLIEPMIKAGCPAEICPACGQARERITDKEVEFISGSGKAGNPPKGKHAESEQATSGQYDIRMGPQVTRRTIGWTACSCGAGWIAGTVLDPFCGSGTVLEVCRLLNRNAIGLELNPEYEQLIRERSMANQCALTMYE